jgi:predicted ATPase
MADHPFSTPLITPREQLDKQTGNDSPPLSVSGAALHMLQTSVLSLDWEISDETVTVFLKAVQRLQDEVPSDPVIQKFILLLGSLGRYIHKRKSSIHPESIRLLHSAFDSLEQVLRNTGLDETARRNLLLDRMADYQKLREILSQPPAYEQESRVSVPVGESEDLVEKRNRSESTVFDSRNGVLSRNQSEGDGIRREVPEDSPEIVTRIVDEIRRIIQSEFQALRAEIRQWRNGK